MELTIKQLRQIIKEELMEVYKGKNRTIHAPGPVALTKDELEWLPAHSKSRYRTPLETGAYILPSENPHSQLDPMVKDSIPPDSSEDVLAQAYELSDTLGSKPDDDLEDFLYGVELSNNPDILVQDAIDTLEKKVKRLELLTVKMPYNMEKRRLLRRMVQFKKRLRRLKHYKTLDRAYLQGDYTSEI